MPTARKRSERPPPAPDDLVRESAGSYRSGDSRFAVQKSDTGWFLVDSEQANEFGQQLIHGPFATLDSVRDAIPGAREIKPFLRLRKGKPSKSGAPATKRPPPPPPPPSSWIDKLPREQAAEVRALIRALEREGIEDAEELVKRHRDDARPTIATRVLESRLTRLVESQPPAERKHARELVRKVVEIVADEGAALPRPLAGWAVVEVEPGTQPAQRRVRPEPR